MRANLISNYHQKLHSTVICAILLMSLFAYVMQKRTRINQVELTCIVSNTCGVELTLATTTEKMQIQGTTATVLESTTSFMRMPVGKQIICDEKLGLEYTLPEGWELRRQYSNLHIISRSGTNEIQPVVSGESDLPFGIWVQKRASPIRYGLAKLITLSTLLDGTSQIDSVGEEMLLRNDNGLKGTVLSGMSSEDPHAIAIFATDGESIFSLSVDGAGWPVRTDGNDARVVLEMAVHAKIIHTCK